MSSLYLSTFNDDDGITEYFFKSLVFHGGIVLFLWGVTLVLNFGSDSLRDANLTLVEGSVRVDVVAMPTMTVRELQNLGKLPQISQDTKAAPAPKIEQKAPEAPVEKVADDSKAPVLETDTKPKESVMDVLKRAAARKIETKGEPVKAQEGTPGLSAEAQGQLRNLVAAGNKLSTGSSIVGSGQGSEMTEFNLYISALPDLVRVNWRLPSYLIDQGLQARVRIYLRPNGELVRAELYASSGNQEYDQRALEAVRVSSPFPNLSDEIKHRGVRGDILLGFPL